LKTDPVMLKIHLHSYGVRISPRVGSFRKGGAGPVGKTLILNGGLVASVPVIGSFVEKSPYKLLEENGELRLYRGADYIGEVREVPTPRFYSQRTSDGTLMEKVALLHGVDCLASTVYQKCVYWETGMRCKFCSIEHSLYEGQTILWKSPRQLAETAAKAEEEGVVKHVTLTTGTPNLNDRGARMLCESVKAIKELTRLPVHVQLEPPNDLNEVAQLRAAGADTIGLHVESFDDKVLREVCPAKRDKERFIKCWKRAVEEFGENQVSSFLILGLGESDESLLTGAEKMARLGVIPFPVPLRPHPKTELGDKAPPTPERTLKIYKAVLTVMESYGLHPEKCLAGCVRCGGCSAINDLRSAYPSISELNASSIPCLEG
jgi:radical SAM protein (TIGR04043 family)